MTVCVLPMAEQILSNDARWHSVLHFASVHYGATFRSSCKGDGDTVLKAILSEAKKTSLGY